LGGHHVTATAKEILEDHNYIDAICIGEGEDVIREVVSMFKTDRGAEKIRLRKIFVPNSYPDLDLLPLPIRNDTGKIVRISTSRGCPYSCSFCTTPGIRNLTGEPIYRLRSADNVVNEIERLYSCDVRQIYINDDLYVLPNAQSIGRAKCIAHKLLEKKIEVTYKAQLRIDSFRLKNEYLLKYLKSSGLRSVFLGVESGSDQILEEYNKRISLAQTKEVLKMYDRVGIEVNAGNILASPSSTMEEICRSINGFHQMGLCYLLFRRVTFRADVFPGTLLERQLEDQTRLERKPRYLPRNYKFLDPRIDDVVNLLAEGLPRYLEDIGATTFRLRHDALRMCYSDGTSAESVLPSILGKWNDRSAQFLLRSFDPSRARADKAQVRSDLDAFTEFTRMIRSELKSFIERNDKRGRNSSAITPVAPSADD
jgi:radical SAM superfamily enzyme YgiQ (UPF0313 family)